MSFNKCNKIINNINNLFYFSKLKKLALICPQARNFNFKKMKTDSAIGDAKNQDVF